MRKLKALTRKRLDPGSASVQLPHQNIDATRPSSQSSAASPTSLPVRPLPPTSSSGTQSQAQAVAPTSATSTPQFLVQASEGPPSTANNASQLPPYGQVAVRRDGEETGNMGSKKDYWKLAVQKLQEEDPSTTTLIDALWQAASTTSSGDLATHLTDALKQSQTALEARRWKLSIGSKEIVVRERYERLAKGLLLFKDILNPAARLDPVHAGIPVAGFCVLIEVCSEDRKTSLTILTDLRTDDCCRLGTVCGYGERS